MIKSVRITEVDGERHHYEVKYQENDTTICTNRFDTLERAMTAATLWMKEGFQSTQG